MRRLTFIVILLASLYGGYWFVGARVVDQAVQTGISDAQADGWTIGYSDLNTAGFPSRFDTTATEIQITPPDGSWDWQSSFMQVFALSYQPNKLIAAVAPTQTFRLGDETIEIETDGLRASAGVKPDTNLSFDAVTAEVGAVNISSDMGWSASLSRALIAMRAADAANTYDIYGDTDDVILPPEVMTQIDPDGQFSATIDRVVLEAQITLDQPIDRQAKDPVAEAIRLNKFDVNWGDISFKGDGELIIDALGVPDGRLTFRTAQWRELITLLVNTGAIQPGIAPTLTNVAQSMTAGDDTLEIPISFQNGFMSVGPLPIGPAPRLR